MNVLRQVTESAGRRFAAAAFAAMLTALPAIPCAAAFFEAIETDAHACCGRRQEHSSTPFSDACKRLCASAASVLPPDTAPPALPAESAAAACPAPAAQSRSGAPFIPAVPADSPPRFVLHCAFLI